jgi:hypothetical protein
VLYYNNNNKIISLHTYKNENEIFSHGNSVVDNDIKYTKPIKETITTPSPHNTDLINKQKLILDSILLNLKELNSLGAIDNSLTDKLNVIKESSLICTTHTFTNIINLINNLPNNLNNNPDNYINAIKKLINLLPNKSKKYKNDLISIINVLINKLSDSYNNNDINSIKIIFNKLKDKSNSIIYNKYGLVIFIKKN